MTDRISYKGKKALVIDDDELICCSVEQMLESRGFQVKSCHRGNEGIAEALDGFYALVLIDVILPKINGFQLLKELRTQSNVPVIMITSRDGESSRIYGFELGADDYITKPFSERELLARVDAVMRRSEVFPVRKEESLEGKIHHGALTIYRDYPKVVLSGETLALTSIEYRILKYLVIKAGTEVSKSELKRVILGHDDRREEQAVEIYIYLLRKKLGDDSKNPRFISTIDNQTCIFLPTTKAISLEIMPE